MSHTIRDDGRRNARRDRRDDRAEGRSRRHPGALGAATGTGWVDESAVARIEAAAAGSGLVDGITGAIVEQVAVQAPAQGQSEPSVVLFAGDPDRMDGFSPIVGSGGTRCRSQIWAHTRSTSTRKPPRAPHRARSIESPSMPADAPVSRARAGCRPVRWCRHVRRSHARLARPGAEAVRPRRPGQDRRSLESRRGRRRGSPLD